MKSKIIIAMVMLSCYSCRKEKQTELNKNFLIKGNGYSITNGSNAKLGDEANYDQMLNTAAYGLLQYSCDAGFRTKVNSEVALQFDGDDNVLLKTLEFTYFNMPQAFSNSISLYGNSAVCYTALPEINECIKGFAYYDEMAYVQIYIPNADKVNLNSRPIICVDPNDEITLNGIYLDANNVLQTVEVDEEMAEQQLVWVISINETEGAISSYSNNVVIPLSGHPDKYLDVRTKDFLFTNRKENWGHGKSEIGFISSKWGMDQNNGFLPSDDEVQSKMKLFCVKKKELNQTIPFEQNLAIATFVTPTVFDEGQFIGLLIYERDKRNNQTVTFNNYYGPPTYDFNYDFCSLETPYLTTRIAHDGVIIPANWTNYLFTQGGANCDNCTINGEFKLHY